jgi:ribosomal protein S18 acetylase RimI-like enzyme
MTTPVATARENRVTLSIRAATPADRRTVAGIILPVIRTGDTYTLPRDMTEDDALDYWFAPDHEVFVACDEGQMLGTYYLRPNQRGGGSHVANCGYMTARGAEGRGIGRAMCEHSLTYAVSRGFRAMQFNFVVSTNTRAVSLWESLGFQIVGTQPKVFRHATLGDVDAYVMYRALDDVDPGGA